jgi:hypothetical protein
MVCVAALEEPGRWATLGSLGVLLAEKQVLPAYLSYMHSSRRGRRPGKDGADKLHGLHCVSPGTSECELI